MEDHTVEPAEQPVVDDPGASPEEVTTDEIAAPPTVGTRRWWIPLVMLGAIVMVGLLASQAYLIFSLDETRTELSATSAQVEDLESQLADVNGAIGSVGRALSDLAAAQAADGSTPAPGLPSGSLPRFSDGQADQAIGMTMGEISGPDAYTGDVVTVDPGDGTKRIWMIWAHWCPYCQEELPALAAAYDPLRTAYPDIEITTVTTSIDPSRGNPLDAYLEAEQFPFPVIVDADLSLAGKMGVSAFPFWLVTDGEGRVLFRTAGFLSEGQIDGLMQNLADYEPQA